MRVDEKKAKILAKYYVDSYLFNGLSVGVFEKEKGKMVALAMSTLYNFGDERVERVPKEHTFRSLQLALENDYFKSKSIEDGTFLEFGIGAVYPEYAMHNISTEALAILEAIARFYGCSAIGGICSSLYTYKVCDLLGHVCTKKIKVSEFYNSKTISNVDLNPKHEYFYWVTK